MSTDDEAVVINKEAADNLKLSDPIGAKLNGINNAGDKQVVIGVVDNIHFQTSKEKIMPVIFYLRSWCASRIVVRFNTENTAGIISFLDEEWKKLNTDTRFEYRFVDEKFSSLYNSERKMGVLISVFTGIAIIIASVGLLGLISITLQMRTKDIGIRKVLGASTADVTAMVVKEYIYIIAFAGLLAVPIVYYFMGGWLDKFIYKEGISFWMFAAGIGIVLFIAIAAILSQIIRAASVNPVDSLKYE